MTRRPFEYAVLRVVPRVERGESMNAGVVVYSQAHEYLGVKIHLDAARLAALDPAADAVEVQAALDAAADVCDGRGPSSAEAIGRRFRWVTAPRSTVVQPGPVHTGLTSDPTGETDRLLRLLVLNV
jgi:Protein of unknown function (DUF3037)